MAVTGLIMECNPFHEGHAYIIHKAVETASAGAGQPPYVIAVMSGSFVQRGEPAIDPKEVRARKILEAGADLVLELPVYCACAGAGYFARGAVTLLQRLGVVTDLVFGSESGDLACLQTAAAFLSQPETPAFQGALRQHLAAGLSFPAARSAAALETAGTVLPEQANDLLAAEYLRYTKEAHITPHPVRRINAPSASAIRSARREADASEICLDTFSQAILYALKKAAAEGSLSDYLDITPDEARRICRHLPQYRSASQFCALLKTRSMTYTRISRALVHVLLGLTASGMRRLQESGLVPCARILGIRRQSRPLLGLLAAQAQIPLITSPARALSSGDLSPAARLSLETDLFASELYALLCACRPETAGASRPDSSAVVPPESARPLIVI